MIRNGDGTPVRRRVTVAAVSVAMVLGGCADDGAGDAGSEETTAPAAQATTVTAVDYAYQDVPEEVSAGTTVTLRNDSTGEAHEVIALRVADGEDRPAEELVQLPPEELLQVAEMRGVALAPPGEDSTAVPTPPLTLEQPGRYLFVCLLPVGAPPEDVLQAAEEFAQSGATEGAPAYPETGPPHVTRGMFAEVEVTAG